MTPISPDARVRAPRSSGQRALAVLLIADALLSFAPVVILGRAIGWPASLDLPAAEQLSRIAAAPGAVMLGYGVYLLYSVLVAPAMIGAAARAFGTLSSPLPATVAAFGVLSALARSIGILRWLTVMPALSAANAAAGAAGDGGAQAQIALVFDAINAYGGGIGEILGVSLFMSLAVGTLSVGALVRSAMPAWLATMGIVVAAMLAALAAPAFGVTEYMPVAVAVSALSVWMMATGVWMWRSKAI